MAGEIAQFGSVLEIASFGDAEETAEFGVGKRKLRDRSGSFKGKPYKRGYVGYTTRPNVYRPR